MAYTFDWVSPRINIRVASACFTFIVSSMCMGASAALPTNKTDTRVDASLQLLQRYKTSHSLDDLRATLYSLQSDVDLDAMTPDNFIDARRALVRGWAKLLKQVELAYDPTFDPSRKFSCPLPESLPNAIGARPCSDPSIIQDAQARAEYSKKLNDMRTQLKRAGDYQQLLNFDQLAMADLALTLNLLRKVAPEAAGSDFPALDSVLQSAGLSEARRTKIDAMLYGNP